MDILKKTHISGIVTGSIADLLGVSVGDYLLLVDGNEIGDIFDYKFYTAAERLVLTVEKKDGSRLSFNVEKDFERDLGILFDDWLIDGAKSCRNKCIFCFIDQLPKGMRESLYFKDDDARLSFMDGNYVTFTNMSEKELDRIIQYRFSPINISVHTTDSDLRVKMLNNKNAGNVLTYVQKLYEAGIDMNFQIVLVKGVNDGSRLIESIDRLSMFIPVAKSLSIVPAGLTKYRNGLHRLEPFNSDDAAQIIGIVEEKQREFQSVHGTRFVFCSDELYILSGRDLPSFECYEDFPQLENGVGMVSLFLDEAEIALARYETFKSNKDKKMSVVTGMAAYPFVRKIATEIAERFCLSAITVIPVENTFFGSGVTVSGLLTAGDIINTLSGRNDLGDCILIPDNMLKSGETLFLDDLTVEDMSKSLNLPVVPVGISGKRFVSAIWRFYNEKAHSGRRRTPKRR